MISITIPLRSLFNVVHSLAVNLMNLTYWHVHFIFFKITRLATRHEAWKEAHLQDWVFTLLCESTYGILVWTLTQVYSWKLHGGTSIKPHLLLVAPYSLQVSRSIANKPKEVWMSNIPILIQFSRRSLHGADRTCESIKGSPRYLTVSLFTQIRLVEKGEGATIP